MTVIATDKVRLSNLIKQELWPEIGYCKEVITINDSAQTLVIGTVLGKVTATGKYKVAVETAVDGSKVADALVIEDKTIAGSTDTTLLVLKRGPVSISKGGLVLGATYDNDAKKLAVYTSLQALGMQVLEAA